MTVSTQLTLPSVTTPTSMPLRVSARPVVRRRRKGMNLLSARRRFRPARRLFVASSLSLTRRYIRGHDAKRRDARKTSQARHGSMGSVRPHAFASFSRGTAIGGQTMNRLLLTLTIVGTVVSLLLSNVAAGQIVPPTKKAARVEIIKGPELELATDFLTIIRWTTNNPGGSNDHLGVEI